jgi:uncharacterized membrane protein YedE/YeeE
MVYVNLADYSAAFLGGLLIAAGASLQLYTFGRVTGFSGILFDVSYKGTAAAWQGPVLLGLVAPGYVLNLLLGPALSGGDDAEVRLGPFVVFDSRAVATENLSLVGFVVAGLLSGVGTKLGNGCTSGHGICGLPRFSLRSWVAVPTFMATAFLTANVKALFWDGSGGALVSPTRYGDLEDSLNRVLPTLLLVTFAMYVVYVAVVREQQHDRLGAVESLPMAMKTHAFMVNLLCGLVGGAGLALSGMCRRTKVSHFLEIVYLFGHWDPSLAFVMGGGVMLNMFTFYYIFNMQKKPLLRDKFELSAIPTTQIDWRLLTGAAIFGVGWGFGGLCPGPGIINLFVLPSHVLPWMVGCVLGQVGTFTALGNTVPHAVGVGGSSEDAELDEAGTTE